MFQIHAGTHLEAAMAGEMTATEKLFGHNRGSYSHSDRPTLFGNFGTLETATFQPYFPKNPLKFLHASFVVSPNDCVSQ